MTDLDLDRMLRRILIDAIKADEACIISEPISFSPSLQHQKSMYNMAKNPLKWLRDRKKTVWQKVLKQIAVIILTISIGFAGLMVVSPSVRAAVIRWVVEWYETHVVYRYSGDDASSESNKYEITALPEGFSEVDRIEFPNMIGVTYADLGDSIICFDYSYMSQGAAIMFNTENAIVSEIAVGNMPGQFFEATVPGEFNTITWIDDQKNIQFSISGCFNKEELLYMALSARQVKTNDQQKF